MTKVTLQINRMEMAMVTLDTEQKLQWLHIEQTQEDIPVQHYRHHKGRIVQQNKKYKM